MKKKGTSFVLVSHNLEEIERLCDRLIWLEKGRIRAIGGLKEIIRDYKSAMRV